MEDKIKTVMSKILKVPIDSIDPDSSPDNIDSWDSLLHMNLMLALEQEFTVSFSDEEIIQAISFGIILETLKERLG